MRNGSPDKSFKDDGDVMKVALSFEAQLQVASYFICPVWETLPVLTISDVLLFLVTQVTIPSLVYLGGVKLGSVKQLALANGSEKNFCYVMCLLEAGI